MKVYVDASAAVKLAATEHETPSLTKFLDDRAGQDVLMSSVLLETEVRRAVWANGLAETHATQALAGISLVAAPRPVFAFAGRLPFPNLRSLDAIHLATAVRHGVDVMLTYDHRLQTACLAIGLETVAPT